MPALERPHTEARLSSAQDDVGLWSLADPNLPLHPFFASTAHAALARRIVKCKSPAMVTIFASADIRSCKARRRRLTASVKLRPASYKTLLIRGHVRDATRLSDHPGMNYIVS